MCLQVVPFVKLEKGSPSTEQCKETNPALHNAIPPSNSKSERNPTEQVVLHTATTIAKRNFQGSAHNIIRKWGRSLKDILMRAKL